MKRHRKAIGEPLDNVLLITLFMLESGTGMVR